MKEKIQELTQLLKATGEAHHQAYLDTDGYDPEWPLWYADYLFERLPAYISASVTRSELVYLMVYLNRIQSEEAPEESWDHFYARNLVDGYLQEDDAVDQ